MSGSSSAKVISSPPSVNSAPTVAVGLEMSCFESYGNIVKSGVHTLLHSNTATDSHASVKILYMIPCHCFIARQSELDEK